MAESFLADVPRQFRRPPSAETLRSVIARRHRDGLRALALVDPDGRPVASAGELDPTPVALPPPSGDPSLVHVGTRVRYLPPRMGPPGLAVVGLGPPPMGPPGESPPGPPPFLPGDDLGPPPSMAMRGGPPRMLVEFEPLMVRSAIAESERTLAVAVIISGLLLAAAAWFWRRSVQSEAMERRAVHQDRLAELGKMTAVIAHEIRNPLAAMKGHAQLLAESLPEKSRTRAQADRVVNASVRLEVLVRELLDFVREGPVALRPCDAAALVREVTDELGTRVEVLAPEAMPQVMLDARRLRHAIANMVQNAAQAGAKTVTVELSHAKGELTIEVRDDGPGLDPNDLETVFEPFVTRRTRGVGLGLAVVRRVAQLHGGDVTARNRPEGGAAFTMVLQAPRAE